MKSSKIWKIIWISGLYIVLFIILYLVVLYKVEWEDKDLNTYLYFYDCSHELCTSSSVQDNYFNKILCEDGQCPYIDTISGENLILKNNDSSWIYDYINGNIVDNKFDDYRYIGNGMYIVMNNNMEYGVIDYDGNLVVPLMNEYIDDYYNGIISYVENDLYGIVSVDRKYNIEPIYEDVILINEKFFAGKIDNVYQIHSYDNININNNKYNFVYSYEDIVLVINNKKIDILDSNLNSTLLMKVDTFYEYSAGQERDSLEIVAVDDYINFKVFVNENEYNKYRYNVNERKLLTN